MFKKIKHYFKYDFLSGHIRIGKLTIYGRNAMHWGCTLYTKKYGYICWRLPLHCYRKWWPLYLYFSPDATPQKSTFMLGKKHDKDEWLRARVRGEVLGHNFNVDKYNDEFELSNYYILQGINMMVDSNTYTYASFAREYYKII